MPSQPRRNNSVAMRQRRQRILEQARLMLASGGMEQLSLRQLADASGVAVGTIYSLIGRKDDVLIALYRDLQERLAERLSRRLTSNPLERVEAVAEEVAALFREDEDYCRAAFLAIQHLDEAWPPRAAVAQLFEAAGALLAQGFRACIDGGLLRGDIPAEKLADLALQSYRMTWMRWACRRIDIDRSRSDALGHLHIILLADATEPFRAQLIGRMALAEGRLPASTAS